MLVFMRRWGRRCGWGRRGVFSGAEVMTPNPIVRVGTLRGKFPLLRPAAKVRSDLFETFAETSRIGTFGPMLTLKPGT